MKLSSLFCLFSLSFALSFFLSKRSLELVGCLAPADISTSLKAICQAARASLPTRDCASRSGQRPLINIPTFSFFAAKTFRQPLFFLFASPSSSSREFTYHPAPVSLSLPGYAISIHSHTLDAADSINIPKWLSQIPLIDLASRDRERKHSQHARLLPISKRQAISPNLHRKHRFALRDKSADGGVISGLVAERRSLSFHFSYLQKVPVYF